jgi:hypothetical protein
MRNQPDKISEQVARNQRVTLLELLDRLLDRGVMVKGEIVLSVADIDLVYLNLGVLLSSVKTIENAARRNDREEASNREEAAWIVQQTTCREEEVSRPQQEEGRKDSISILCTKENSPSRNSDGKTRDGTSPAAISKEPDKLTRAKTDIDPKNVEKGLVKLVLTLVDLIRKLMEKQAIRRIEDGQLSDREIEDVGNTFLLLDEKMSQLKKHFGLKDEDLNLDLGPLGELV